MNIFLTLSLLSSDAKSSFYYLFSSFGLILTIVGIGCVLYSFGDLFLFVYKTKNTVALNVQMFTLHMLVALFYLFSAIFTLVDISGNDEVNIFNKIFQVIDIIKFIFMTLLNLMLCSAMIYMILLKFKNKKEAFNLGMSELQHYNEFISKGKFPVSNENKN